MQHASNKGIETEDINNIYDVAVRRQRMNGHAWRLRLVQAERKLVRARVLQRNVY